MPYPDNYLRPSLCLATLLVVVGGCAATRNGFFRAPGPAAPTVLTAMPTAMDIVGAVNANTARVRSYYTNSARFTVPGIGGLPLMRGNIALERPLNFRLTAGIALTGGDEIDLGSNAEMLWFWVKRNTPPALYFCRHDQFATSGARQVLPVDPTWIGDALGLVELNPNSPFEGPVAHSDGTFELRSPISTPTGPMTRSVFVDATRAWVLRQHLYDSSGKLVASAKAEDFRYDESANVSLPRRVTIRVPASELTLTIDVGNVAINVPIPNAALMFQPPALSNYPRVDLGSIPAGTVFDPSAIPPQTVVPAVQSTSLASTPTVPAAPASPVSQTSYAMPPPIAPTTPSFQRLPSVGVALDSTGSQ